MIEEKLSVALFGEAEKGEYRRAHYCASLPQLIEYFGHPPSESRGIYYAIQALLYERVLFFFRVQEEGFSKQDYIGGLQFMQNYDLTRKVSAICIPGVGDSGIINAIAPLCMCHNIILIVTESDLYDYLTEVSH